MLLYYQDSITARLAAKLTGLLLLTLFIILLSLICIQIPWVYTVILSISMVVLGVILLKPVIGMYLLLFTVPITSFTCYAAIKGDWNFIIGVSFIDLIPVYFPLVLFSSLGFIIHKWGKISKYSTLNPLEIPLLILLLYAAATILWSDNKPHSLFQFLILLNNAMLFCLLVALIKDTTILKKALWLWSISIGFQALFSIASFFFDSAMVGKEIFPNVVAGFNFFGSFLQPSGWPQVASGLQDHHETALLMNMTFPVVIGLLLTNPTRLQKHFLIGLLILLMFVTLRTESRAGFGSLLLMGSALFIIIRKLRKHFIRLLFIFCLSIITIYTLQQITLSLIIQKNVPPRLFSLGIKVIQSQDFIDPELPNKEHSRKRLWKNSFHKYSSVFVQGFGAGNLKEKLEAPHAHNIFFSLLFDFGFVGLFFMVYVMLSLAKQFIVPLRYQSSSLQIIAACLSGGLIAIGIHGLVDFEYNTTTIWLYLALTTSSLNLVRIEQQAENNHLCPGLKTLQPH